MRTAVLVSAALALSCCQKAPPPPPATKPAAAPVPPPAAKKATMICRNSQTGAKAQCGTPNAVMVGIKTE